MTELAVEERTWLCGDANRAAESDHGPPYTLFFTIDYYLFVYCVPFMFQ